MYVKRSKDRTWDGRKSRIKSLTLVILLLVLFFLGACVAPNTALPSSPISQVTNTHIYFNGKIIARGSGEPVELINNPKATNPTFSELVAFLEKDPTDQYSYIVGPPKNAFVSSDFAETIHNNAEAAGLRAAWVDIGIEGEANGHALNAFETTDLGLVYIDCTGKGLWDDKPRYFSGDRRAHVEIGKPYALAGMNTPASKFRFYISPYPNPDIFKGENGTYEQRKSAMDAFAKWQQTHDLEATGQELVQEWLQKYKAELSKSGRVLEPIRLARWIVNMPDCWDVPWFQSDPQLIYPNGYIPNGVESYQDAKVQQKLIEVDGLSLAWEVSWQDDEGNWFKPFQVWGKTELISRGVVEGVHMYWGE